MAGLEITHVAVLPPPTLDSTLVANVAAIINKDLYATRLLLTGKMPKLIAHCPSPGEAASVIERLKALGLAAVVCEDAFLRRPPAVFKVRTLAISSTEVSFRDQAGEIKRVNPLQAFLLLQGSHTAVTETKKTVTEVKFSISKTIMLGGIPVFSKKKAEVTDRSENSELFLRLYDRESAENVIEFSQFGLDYSFLGEKRSLSSVTNFNSVIGEIRRLFPDAIFDDKLVGIQGVKTSSVTAGNDTEVNCKLLYLYYRFLKAY
jgi:hypothetical protein